MASAPNGAPQKLLRFADQMGAVRYEEERSQGEGASSDFRTTGRKRNPSYDVDNISGRRRCASAEESRAPARHTGKRLPAAGDWVYEIKLHGYRILTRIDAGKVHLVTRNGNDWTERMALLVQDLGTLDVGSAWLDGEVVVMNDQGVPDFNALQNAFDTARAESILYFVFDLPYVDGYDLRSVPLHARKKVLKELLSKATDRIRYSEEFSGDAATVLKGACAMKLEGIIAKRSDAPYVSTRTDTWLKLKCSRRQEFVIVGFRDRANATAQVGSLLLGYHDEEGNLTYAGAVGTGWNAATAAALRKRLAQIEMSVPTVDPQTVKPGRWTRSDRGPAHWVKPEVVAEVSFTEWTPDGHVRHPSFVALRSDKPPRQITREAEKGNEMPPGSAKVKKRSRRD